MLRVFHHPDLSRVDTAHHYIERQWSPQKVRDRYDWIVGYDARAVGL